MLTKLELKRISNISDISQLMFFSNISVNLKPKMIGYNSRVKIALIHDKKLVAKKLVLLVSARE
jgi:hypothetical protein